MIPGAAASILLSTSSLVQTQSVVRKLSFTGGPSGVTLSGIRAGDLLVMAAARADSFNGITTPAGWTQIQYGLDSGQVTGLLAYKIATGSETSVNPNAELVIVTVYRGFAGIAEIGASAKLASSSASATFPALSLQGGNGKSFVFALGVKGGPADLAAPASMQRVDAMATGQISLTTYETGSGVASFSSRTSDIGYSTLWRTMDVEIKLSTSKSFTGSSTIIMPDCNALTVTAQGGTGSQGAGGLSASESLADGETRFWPGGLGGAGGVGGKATKLFMGGGLPAGGSSVSMTVNSAQATFTHGPSPTGYSGAAGEPGTDAGYTTYGEDSRLYYAGTNGAQGSDGVASGGDTNETGGSTTSVSTITLVWS